MRIDQLYYFLEAVRTGSFTKAANNLYLQQPSLRKGIMSLEQELGRDLFTRTVQGVVLTKYGEECLPRIQQMVDIYESLKQDAAPAKIQQVLHVEMTNTFSSMVDISMSDDLYCKTAKVRNLRISVNDKKNDIVRRVMKEEIDIGFLSHHRPDFKQDVLLNNYLNKEYQIIDLAQIDIGISMRKDHPLARRKSIALEDLLDYKIIFSMSPTPTLLEFFEDEIGKDKMNYTIVTNLKLINKYCLQENSLFIQLKIKDVEELLDEGMIFRTFTKKYHQHYLAITRHKETREAVFDYIKIVQIMLQQFLG